MNTPEQQYIKGFNNGYILSKYEPELTAKLAKTLQPSTDYLEGFFNGKEEYEFEKSREQLKEFQQLRARSKERGEQEHEL